MTLDGGPMFTRSPAASISVLATDQAEVDRLWELLTADGGKESMCGWLVDRFGVSWQVVPEVLPSLIGAQDQVAAGRVRDAMMKVKRIIIADLQAAFRGA